MFDPAFFSDEQVMKLAAAFNKYLKPNESTLNKSEMRSAIKCLDFVPTPTDTELSSMCKSDSVDIEEFIMIIYWYMRSYYNY